jgi:hypothetical protein
MNKTHAENVKDEVNKQTRKKFTASSSRFRTRKEEEKEESN